MVLDHLNGRRKKEKKIVEIYSTTGNVKGCLIISIEGPTKDQADKKLLIPCVIYVPYAQLLLFLRTDFAFPTAEAYSCIDLERAQTWFLHT